MIFFAAALLSRRRAHVLIAAGVVAGSAAGLVRMAQGGHFLSDVVFAGVAMALTAVVTFRIFEALSFGDRKPRLALVVAGRP